MNQEVEEFAMDMVGELDGGYHEWRCACDPKCDVLVYVFGDEIGICQEEQPESAVGLVLDDALYTALMVGHDFNDGEVLFDADTGWLSLPYGEDEEGGELMTAVKVPSGLRDFLNTVGEA